MPFDTMAPTLPEIRRPQPTTVGLAGAISMPQTDRRPEQAPGATPAEGAVERPGVPVLEARRLSVHYGTTTAVREVSLHIPEREVVAFIGPSGCGKSTLLRSFNRMNDLLPGARITGQALFHGEDLYGADVDPVEVRRRIGMVFQRPNPFPKSIYENVAFGLRINGYRGDIDDRVEHALRQAALWDDVAHRLDSSALALSGGQQQRLCIARALAIEPEVILMDEPASALDPIATQRIEELILELKERYTVIVVTHNMQQAARISDHTAFLYMGEIVEYDNTARLFSSPRNPRTEAYISGRFG